MYKMSARCFDNSYITVFGFKDIFGVHKFHVNYAENHILIDYCISAI